MTRFLCSCGVRCQDPECGISPSPRAAGNSVAEIVQRARDLVEPALRMAVRRLPAATAEVVGYHLGWEAGPRGVAAGGGGKAVRPALVFQAAEAVGGTAEAAIPAAVAVELVHNFSLLHDDVMDNDRMRRHRPTAWVVFGAPAAILAGDALLVLATQILAESDGPLAVLGEALLTLVHGQCADLTFADRAGVSLAECLEMASAKTGALLGGACALGAYAGGADPDRAAALRRFGEHLGLAFQLVDDLLGIWGDPRITGKPAGADLAARKKSLPVVSALTSGHPVARELAGLYESAQPLAGNDLIAVADLIEQAGGRDWAGAESRRQLDAALSWLAAARPEPSAAERLSRLAHLITDRDH